MAASVEDVWGVVVEQYDWYMRVAKYYQPHDAEDVVHDVLLRFVPKVVETYQPEKGTPLAAWMRIKWLYMVADYLRDLRYKNVKKVFAAKTVKFSDIGQTFDAGEIAEKTAACTDYDRERAMRVINVLPARSRDILLLRMMGYTHREIGDFWLLSESRVSQILKSESTVTRELYELCEQVFDRRKDEAKKG